MFKEYSDLLSPAEAAKALSIGKNSIYRLIREKQIGVLHIGRKLLIPKMALITYVRSALYTVKKL